MILGFVKQCNNFHLFSTSAIDTFLVRFALEKPSVSLHHLWKIAMLQYDMQKKRSFHWSVDPCLHGKRQSPGESVGVLTVHHPVFRIDVIRVPDQILSKGSYFLFRPLNPLLEYLLRLLSVDTEHFLECVDDRLDTRTQTPHGLFRLFKCGKSNYSLLCLRVPMYEYLCMCMYIRTYIHTDECTYTTGFSLGTRFIM